MPICGCCCCCIREFGAFGFSNEKSLMYCAITPRFGAWRLRGRFRGRAAAVRRTDMAFPPPRCASAVRGVWLTQASGRTRTSCDRTGASDRVQPRCNVIGAQLRAGPSSCGRRRRGGSSGSGSRCHSSGARSMMPRSRLLGVAASMRSADAADEPFPASPANHQCKPSRPVINPGMTIRIPPSAVPAPVPSRVDRGVILACPVAVAARDGAAADVAQHQTPAERDEDQQSRSPW